MSGADIARMNERLRYEPETGQLYWRERFNNSVPADLRAGYVSPAGYVEVMLDRRMLKGHRIAWALYHGSHPAGQIDHINHDRADNRIANLRDVSSATNQRNSSMDRRNTSGVCGVRWREDRRAWEAQIRVDNRPKYLGRFTSFDEAVAARKSAENQFGFHANHGLAGPKNPREMR